MNTLHLSTSAHASENNSYRRKRYNGHTSPLGRRQVIDSPFLETTIRSPPFKIDSSTTNGWTNIQFLLPIAMARVSNKLLMKPVPLAWSPELSPDGEKILYTQAIKGPHQIFKIDVHSGIQTPLTDKIWSFGGDWFDPMYALSVSPEPHLLTTTWGMVKK